MTNYNYLQAFFSNNQASLYLPYVTLVKKCVVKKHTFRSNLLVKISNFALSK